MLSRLLRLIIIVFTILLTFMPVTTASGALLTPQKGPDKPPVSQALAPHNAGLDPLRARLVKEIRHELVTLPYYDVFDWLEGEVKDDGTVVLRGQVVRPTTKSEAEARVKSIEGVSRVDNQIEVLPVSPHDDRLRAALYRAIYRFNSPLQRYATRAMRPIHIIVKNGRVALKGVVATEMDKRLAYTAARGVPGVFAVTNELRVEQPAAS
jgi:hyperosmotically inducible protein